MKKYFPSLAAALLLTAMSPVQAKLVYYGVFIGTVTSTTVTLTVNTQPTTTIPPTNGGGGGGGAVSPWALLSLGALALIGYFSRRH